MRTFFKLTAVCGALLLIGCGDDAPAAAPASTAAAVKRAAPAAYDAGVEAPAYLYSYNPVAKRDPFRGQNTETDPSQAPEPTKGETCDEPLCQFDIDELTLVAVVSGDSNPVAMVEDRLGVGHLVRRNTRLGKQGGKATSILRDCVVVTSFVRGVDGRAQPNRQNMCVKKDSRQVPPLDLLTGKIRE